MGRRPRLDGRPAWTMLESKKTSQDKSKRSSVPDAAQDESRTFESERDNIIGDRTDV